MSLKKITAILLGVTFALALSLTYTRASNQKPNIVHPITGRAPVATYVVNKTTDSGDNTNAAKGTLRRAMVDANNTPGFDLIIFDIPGSGVQTITVINYFPILSDNAGVMIDGTQSDDRIEIDFSQTSGHYGLHFRSHNNVIKGLTLNGLPNAAAIGIENGNNNTIVGNFIGTNTAGTGAKPNLAGILLNNSHHNRIGGTEGVSPGGACTGDCNLLSGNTLHGIVLDNNSSNNRILGNFIGVNKNGNAALSNHEDGILIANSPNNIIGGSSPAERNVITANRVLGIEIALANSHDNLVQGNYIGTNSAGTAIIRVLGPGIVVGLDAHDNVIDGNVISGHQQFGVLVFLNAVRTEIKNNRIGISPFDDSNFGNGMKGIEIQTNNNYVHHNRIANNDSDGVRVKKGVNNRISANEIFNNRTFGINLGTDAFSPNDGGDGDGGANGLQNFPTFRVARHKVGNLIVKGNLNSHPNARYTLEFFQNPACDIAFGNPVGEGKVYLGSTEVTTDGSGNVKFRFVLAGHSSTGVVTANATDSSNNTSEFSYCKTIQ